MRTFDVWSNHAMALGSSVFEPSVSAVADFLYIPTRKGRIGAPLVRKGLQVGQRSLQGSKFSLNPCTYRSILHEANPHVLARRFCLQRFL